MVSLEQIKLLEQKVEQALKRIVELQNYKQTLEHENEELKLEVELLREQCENMEKEEAKIEQGIISVLDKLNNVEDSIRQSQEGENSNAPHENTIIKTKSMEKVEQFFATMQENKEDINSSSNHDSDDNFKIVGADDDDSFEIVAEDDDDIEKSLDNDTSDSNVQDSTQVHNNEQSKHLDIF